MSTVPSAVEDETTPLTFGEGEAKRGKVRQLAVLVFAHTTLGLLFYQFPNLASLHVYAVIALGIFWATSRSQIYATYVATYVVGSEVLWRMTETNFFWEGSKYVVVLILALSLLREKKKPLPIAVLFYFLLLLPSTILTLDALGLSATRDAISFNLSGPFALFVSAWFFSNLRVDSRQLIDILAILVSPILTSATYALLLTLSTSEIRWSNDSMFETSGGFGPNQMSTIMGLGLVATLIMLLFGNRARIFRVILSVLAIVLFVQGLLTFSRGGMLAAGVTSIVVMLHMIRERKLRMRLITLSMITVPIIILFVIPSLNDFTQGFLEIRFTDASLTNRDVILLEELQLFQGNLLFGVGPGVGNVVRGAAAHTEMTRLLAEHGLLGASSLVLLFVMPLLRYAAPGRAAVKGVRLGWMLWALLVMSNAAMRLAAIPFAYGLAFAHFELDDSA